MTHEERNTKVIHTEREIMNASLSKDAETQDFAAKTAIYLALQDISISLASIADYFTEKEK